MTILGRGRPNRKYPLLTTVLQGSTPVTIPNDPGAFTDALTVTVVAPLTESGTGTDALTVPAETVPLTDTGTGTDALSAGVPTALPGETGTFTDALTVTLRQANLAETSTATDAATVSATVPLAETATGTTLLGVDGVPVSLTGQTGTFTDTFTVTLRQVNLVETGTLTDGFFALGPPVIAVGGVTLASANLSLAGLASANSGAVTVASTANGQVALVTSGAGVATVTSSADAELVLATAGAGQVTVQT